MINVFKEKLKKCHNTEEIRIYLGTLTHKEHKRVLKHNHTLINFIDNPGPELIHIVLNKEVSLLQKFENVPISVLKQLAQNKYDLVKYVHHLPKPTRRIILGFVLNRYYPDMLWQVCDYDKFYLYFTFERIRVCFPKWKFIHISLILDDVPTEFRFCEASHHDLLFKYTSYR